MISTKKAIIITISIIISIVSIAALLLLSNPETPANPNPPSTDIPPSFPATQDKSKEEKIKEQFESYTAGKNSQVAQEKVNATEMLDENNTVIPLDDLTNYLDVNIPGHINKIINKKDYQFFSCQSENNKKDYGFFFNIDPIMTEEEIMSQMKNWERQLLKDLYAILFPNVQFTPSQLEQPLNFQNGQYRYAIINLPDGTQGSINYIVINETVFIASSLNCLSEGTEKLFSL